MSSTDADPNDFEAPDDAQEDVQADSQEDVQADASATDADSAVDGDGEEEQQRLTLEVDITEPGTCQRHITVTVSRDDVDRYLKNAYAELAPKAEVPGFRPGRAPRKLVEARFKDQVSDQVKGSLLTDSLEQVSEDHEFSAISEPDFDFEAVSIPDEGPFTFEFDIEVRPEFDVPSWDNLKLERPVHEYTDEDVLRHKVKLLERNGKWVDREGAVEAGDRIEVELKVELDGKVINEETLNLRVSPTISFRDCQLENFDELAVGAEVGAKLETTVTVSDEAPEEAVRGKDLALTITINKIRGMELPEINAAFLDSIGGFEDEDELHEGILEELNRQLDYTQQQRLREQITAQLTESANWDLPPDLLRRQAKRELDRSIMELQRSGFPDEMIRAYENQIRQNSLKATERSIKEHFIFERIAEDEEIDASDADFDHEVELIGKQRGESPRRVRARLEKRGQMDALRNQIVERKVIDMICEKATFTDVPLDDESDDDVYPVAVALAGGHDISEIPEAKHGGEAEELPDRADHT